MANGIELVGMGSALAVDPDLPHKWQNGQDATVALTPVRIKDKALASVAGMARVRQQLRRLGAGRGTRPGTNPKVALVRESLLQRQALRRYRTWLQDRTAAA